MNYGAPDGQVPATLAKADAIILSIKKGMAWFSFPSMLPVCRFQPSPL